MDYDEAYNNQEEDGIEEGETEDNGLYDDEEDGDGEEVGGAENEEGM